MKHWLLIYDIKDEKRLAKVAKIMENYGIRVQYSVFEAICNREVIDKLRKEINNVIANEDFVVYFELCGHDWQKQIKYGPVKYTIYEEKDFYIM